MNIDWTQIQGATGKIVAAILILIVGYILARALESILRKFLTKNKFINEKILPKFEKQGDTRFAHIAGRSVFYILILFVLVAIFQVLGLTIITEPFNNFLNKISSYLPQLFGAVILLLVAWAVATVLKKMIIAILGKTKIDEKLQEDVISGGKQIKLSTTIAELVYWGVFLLFLPAILTALSLSGLLSPVQNLVNILLSYLPNLFAAALVVCIGWVIARLVKNLVTLFFKSMKVDDLGKKAGFTAEENTKSLSELLGMIVYVLILIPVVISGLNILGIQSIAKPATDMLSIIFNFIPSLFSAFIILAFAYFIGKLVSDLVISILAKFNINRVLPLIGVKNAKINLPQIVGKLILIAIVLFAALESADVIGFSKLSALIQQFIIFATNILIGAVIIGFGLYIADLVAGVVRKSEMKNADVLALICKAGLLVLAVTMGLSQMGLATTIINYAFVLIVGAVAVAFAVAFGIGGRDIAAKKLDEMNEKLNKKE